jgi:hypothetical protein
MTNQNLEHGRKKELLNLRNAWPKICLERRQSALFTVTGKYRQISKNSRDDKKALHYSEMTKRHHNNIHRFYCCRVSKQGFLMHTKLRPIHVCRVYIHTCSLLYFLTTTGTLVGGICQS